MASLFNTRISDTYPGLIKTIDNAAITATLKEITDGNGTGTGLFINTAGDFKVNSILEFGSLKDTAENIIITKFVDAADGISNNDNDTTIPTTAAIVDYVAAQITIEDLDFTGDTGTGQIDLDSQILAINGTTNQITTVASGQSVTFSLNSTGVVLPNNSTATTQTAGNNSTKIATTAYVDTLDAASDLDFSGDSGSGDVNLNTQTFAITGTANQIESSASNQGLSLQFPSAGVTLPNGSVATTQASSDDSTKVATTAYVKGLNNASDLDFTTDSGSGAVVLNSETLSVVGTTNEIETSGTGQEIQIGLPSSISTNLIGNVTGNLTGNVTGNVTGDLTGNSAGTHTGSVIGNVTGNVTGDVTGDVTGNADTATAWQTARNLSLTGQATGTISSVDGTNNVSGAVTLDNNSVTAKVLTGLTSPSASSVLASDTIVEGFGKLQSQINGLAGGLRFMGSWDASSNSPVLGSGGGEAAAGTTTAVQTNKLIDSSQSFISSVTVGDQVVNQIDGQIALVTGIDSNTTLSLSADIMISGEDYTIDNSPFITQGHYYVVNVGGTTSLNGISSWTVGDWVIAGANNQWTKLDHSQVDGTGTTGNLTKWSSTSVIADSIVSESGTAITVDGSLSTNTNLSSTGDFAVNTNKFTVAAASGNTAFAGDLAINTDKFTVNATSGNTVVAGTLNSGAITSTGNASINGTVIGTDQTFAGEYRTFAFGTNANGYNRIFATKDQTDGIYLASATGQGLKVRVNGNSTNVMTIDSSGNSTFAGNVTLSSTAPLLYLNNTTASTGKNWRLSSASNGKFFITQEGVVDAVTLDHTSGNATFAGTINSGAITSTGKIATSGEIEAGSLDINGNADIDGNLTILGTTALDVTGNANDNWAGRFENTDSGGFGALVKIAGTSANEKIFEARVGNSSKMLITGDGNASFAGNMTFGGSGTFASSVTVNTNDSNILTLNRNSSVGGYMVFRNGNSDKLYIGSRGTTSGSGGTGYDIFAVASNDLKLFTNATLALTLDTSQNATFAGKIIAPKLSIQNQINTTSTNLEINYENGDGTTTNFRDFYIRDGKNGVILNIEGSSKNSTFAGTVETTTLRTDTVNNKANSANIIYRNLTDTLIGGGSLANKVTIQDGGNVGIGTNDPDYKLDILAASQYALRLNTSDSNGCFLAIQTNGTAKGYLGSSYHLVAGTPSANDITLRAENNLQFTTGGGTERMRITSGGDVLLSGRTSFSDWVSNSGFYHQYRGATIVTRSSATVMDMNRLTSDGIILEFRKDSVGVGSISTNGNSLPSDRDFKKDITDLELGLDFVSTLKPKQYRYKISDDNSPLMYGVIAQDLEQSLLDFGVNKNEAVLLQSKEKETEQDSAYQLDYLKITPILINAIQELKAEVDLLKQECKCKN